RTHPHTHTHTHTHTHIHGCTFLSFLLTSMHAHTVADPCTHLNMFTQTQNLSPPPPHTHTHTHTLALPQVKLRLNKESLHTVLRKYKVFNQTHNVFGQRPSSGVPLGIHRVEGCTSGPLQDGGCASGSPWGMTLWRTGRCSVCP